MNILYIGSSGPLSFLPLEALIHSQFSPTAIAVDSIKHDVISTINKNSNSLEALAFFNNIPLIKLTKNLSTNISKISEIQPDIIFVSCYARKLPIEIISLAKIGCFNVHPSMLPAYRGPTPLFWQFRNGEEKFGVTLHRMTSKYDAGNIISQRSMDMPDGVSKEDASKLLATLASKMLLTSLPLIEQGTVNDIPQNETISSYHSFPQNEDYRVSVSWTAKRLYNFIKANKREGVFFPCEIAGKDYELIEATSYQEEAYLELIDREFFISDDVLSFKCQKGYLQCVFK
jgi:methionyl-tRNA formyltransferase